MCNHLTLSGCACCSKCEIKLEGEEPWAFPGAADDLEIIHTPGHTFGHLVLLHKPSKYGLPLSHTCLITVGYPLWRRHSHDHRSCSSLKCQSEQRRKSEPQHVLHTASLIMFSRNTSSTPLVPS